MLGYALIRQPHTEAVRGGCLTGTTGSGKRRGDDGPKFTWTITKIDSIENGEGGHSATKRERESREEVIRASSIRWKALSLIHIQYESARAAHEIGRIDIFRRIWPNHTRHTRRTKVTQVLHDGHTRHTTVTQVLHELRVVFFKKVVRMLHETHEEHTNGTRGHPTPLRSLHKCWRVSKMYQRITRTMYELHGQSTNYTNRVRYTQNKKKRPPLCTYKRGIDPSSCQCFLQ